MVQVYFIEAKQEKDILEKIGVLFIKVFPDIIKKGDSCAVKCHFGEPGNITFVKPFFYRDIIEKIKQAGAKPFLTDSNALYKGKRHNATDHLETATKHGFTELGIPVVIADGEYGEDSVEIEINKNYFKKVKVAKEIVNADSIIAVSHFKGHMGTGFGGAIKNLSMGCASRAGKQQMHSSTKPSVDKSKCINCKKCAKSCPENCISYANGYAVIDSSKCVGCDECVIVCPTGAIGMRIDTGPKELQEKMAEYALGAVKDKRIGCINFLINITEHCDCLNQEMKPVIENIGVLASLDPVAIDQASFDLVMERAGKDLFKDMHGFDSTLQLKYAEEIGLGTRKYKLVRI